MNRVNALMFAIIVKEFQAGPSSATELANLTGVSRPTIRLYLQTLHKHGCLHVVSYECDNQGRERSPVYALGHGEDIAKRQPQPHARCTARWRAAVRLRLIERMAA